MRKGLEKRRGITGVKRRQGSVGTESVTEMPYIHTCNCQRRNLRYTHIYDAHIYPCIEEDICNDFHCSTT